MKSPTPLYNSFKVDDRQQKYLLRISTGVVASDPHILFSIKLSQELVVGSSIENCHYSVQKPP
jgi:hypothetical protein